MSNTYNEEEEDRITVDDSDSQLPDESRPLLYVNGGNLQKKNTKMRTCCSVCSGLSGLVFVVLAVLVACLFDPFITSFIDNELVIKNDTSSEMYKLWVDPPVVPYLRVYFFNLTNSEDFLKLKTKPIFKEVGPYSYREKWKKEKVLFHNNNTVTYQTRKLYYFDRSQSSGDEDDIIHTLNVPVNAAIPRVSKLNRFAQLAFASLMAVLNETAFVNKTVNELMWGYDDKLMEMARKLLPAEDTMPYDKFGFFYLKNGSTDGVFTVYTGAGNIGNYSVIDMFNSSRELKYWNTAECNAINGTDGTSYPPHLIKSMTLYMFNENLCRSLPLVYNHTVMYRGIEAYRFVPPADVFADVSVKPENLCYCVGGPPCIGGGVFNISACRFNVSSVLSWPHFYQADRKYLDGLEGLHPDPVKHGLYIDVNPRLGMPMSAQARLQVNFVTMNLSTVPQVVDMTPMVFPILWFEDGVDKLSPKVMALIEKGTYLPKVLKTSLLCVFLILGLSLLLVCVSCLIRHRRRSTSNLVITTKDSPNYSSTSSTDVSGGDGRGHSNPIVSSKDPD